MFVKREEREEVMQCVHRHRVHTGMYTDTAYIQVCTQTPRTYRYIHRHRVHTGIYTDTAYVQVYTQTPRMYRYIHRHRVHTGIYIVSYKLRGY